MNFQKIIDRKLSPATEIAWLLHMNSVNDYRLSKSKLPKTSDIPGLERYSQTALSGYPLAIMTWEAFLHECVFSDFTFLNIKDHILWELKDKIDFWDTETKAYFIPKLLFGKTFDKSAQPFQDFKKLIQIRNAFVHYKSNNIPYDAIDYLKQKKIALPTEGVTWTIAVSSIECHKWAINTIVDMINTFATFFPLEFKDRVPFAIERYSKV